MTCLLPRKPPRKLTRDFGENFGRNFGENPSSDPELTLADVAQEIGLTRRAVDMASSKLVKEGHLKYVGPQKGGHWEVSESP